MILREIANATGLRELYLARIARTASHRYRTYNIEKSEQVVLALSTTHQGILNFFRGGSSQIFFIRFRCMDPSIPTGRDVVSKITLRCMQRLNIL